MPTRLALRRACLGAPLGWLLGGMVAPVQSATSDGTALAVAMRRAVALRDWSSSVWTALDEIQADVMAGNRSLPALPELPAELPQPPA